MSSFIIDVTIKTWIDFSAFLRLPKTVASTTRNVKTTNKKNIGQKSGGRPNPLKKNPYARGGKAIKKIKNK